MTEEHMGKDKRPSPIDNVISDETGEFDQRFILWETLPSQLSAEQRELWEELKQSRLRPPRS